MSEYSTTPNTTSTDNKQKTKLTLVAGILAGLTASACCAGPLVLLMLGISGSWIGNLSALEPLRPAFIVLALGLLFFAYRRIFKTPACTTDSVCATASGQKTQKTLFWITTLVIFLSIAFPWYGIWLFDA